MRSYVIRCAFFLRCSIMLGPQLQFDIACRFNYATHHGDITLPIILQSAHRRGSSSEGFPALVCAACFLHGDEACALTVCRLINITIDAVPEAKSPTESLFRLQRSALGVLHFLFK